MDTVLYRYCIPHFLRIKLVGGHKRCRWWVERAFMILKVVFLEKSVCKTFKRMLALTVKRDGQTESTLVTSMLACLAILEGGSTIREAQGTNSLIYSCISQPGNPFSSYKLRYIIPPRL